MKRLLIIVLILLIPGIVMGANTVKNAAHTIEVSAMDSDYDMPNAKKIKDVIFYPGGAGDICIIRDTNGADDPVSIPFSSSDGKVQIYKGGGVLMKLQIDYDDARTSLTAGALVIIHFD